MPTVCKENDMTVACGQQKRQADDGNGNSCVQSQKKLRVLEPLQLSAWYTSAQPSVGITLTSPSTTTAASAKSHKKRSRVDGVETYASPAVGKRGRRSDGSCTTAVSPRSAAAALEEQLSFPGLERDPDLEVQQVYITRQLQQSSNSRPAAPQQAATASPRVSTLRRQASDVASDCAKDAAKSSRGRDQAHIHRGRDQQQTVRSAVPAEVPASASAAERVQPQERVCLNLTTDKEWQRLFAVLTISGQPSHTGELEQEEEQQQQPACGSTAYTGPSPAAAGGTSSAAVATSAALEVAPATPSRSEMAPQLVPVAAEVATPTRKSFLLTEFTRVQARLTPDRELTPQASRSCMEVMA